MVRRSKRRRTASFRIPHILVDFTLAASLLAPSIEAEPAGQLKGVRFAPHGEYTRVVLDLEGRVNYKLGHLSAPERLYLDLFDTQPGPALKSGSITVEDAVLKQIRVGRPQAAVTRVVMDLQENADPNMFWMASPPRLVVDLRRRAIARPGLAAVPGTGITVQPGPEAARERERASSAPAAPPVSPPPTLPAAPPERTVEPAPPELAAARPPALPGASAALIAPGPPPPPAPAPIKPAEPERTLRIPHVARAPKLEDFLNGRPREAEARVKDFFQRTPGDGTPVSQPTSAYLSYDDKNLYVVFVCVEDPGRVRAHMAKREDINEDDRVSVSLDTFHDRRRAYLFATNALGVQQDGISTEGQSADLRFDTLWYSLGRLTSNGYVVWMAIPFKSLRFSDEPAQTWGIALGRTIPRNNESVYWPYISRRVQGFIPQLGTLEGIERVSAGRNVQLIPYGTFAHARLLDSAAPRFYSKDDWRGGLDAKVVMRNALTLDLTLNPDFSQVESDDPQVTINQRFEVFFPEKRPFFIENSGFFQTPINLFFSRRIADPEFGGRLTGKVGRWAVGALAADDRAPGKRLAPGDSLYESRAVNGALRLQRELGSQSTIGMLATSRDFGSSSNRVVSLDTRLRLTPNWFLTGQAARSYDHQLNGKRLDGPAYYAELLRSGRHFSYTGSYADRSPDFRSQLGFIPRVNVRQTDHYAGYTWQPEGSRLLGFGPQVSTGWNWDRQGRIQDRYAYANFVMDFTGPTGFNVSRYQAYEYYLGTGFRHFTNGVSVYTGRLRWLSIAGSQYQGTSINYSPPSGLAPFLGNTSSSSVSITLRPTPRFRLDETYYFSRLGTRPGTPPPGPSDPATIFNNHLLRTKLNYQFSRALSIRTILDYYATLVNPALIADSPFKRFTGDILITYLLNPGTALYIGYTDRYDNLVLDPTTPPTLRMTRSPATSTGRQFFIKISYLLRY